MEGPGGGILRGMALLRRGIPGMALRIAARLRGGGPRKDRR